ncbi:helix-turn-helix domain-containing protein [Amycolatopsis mongoliensis]|uniref:helix-turn-helix domain-containing protein n=1 Tax=Amycolatopsis mongoliensis TaxID=715475 RepID=UPI0038CC0491
MLKALPQVVTPSPGPPKTALRPGIDRRGPQRRLGWSAPGAAELLGMSSHSVRRRVRSGQLGGFISGRSYLIPEDEIQAYLARGATRRQSRTG